MTYKAYNAYLSVKKGSRDTFVHHNRKVLHKSFTFSPSYYRVLMSTPSIPLEDSYEIDSQIVDNTDLRDEKKLTTYYDVALSSGCMFYWQDSYWLAIHFDTMGDVYKRAVISRCYTTLRWQDENGTIREVWFAKKTDVSPNFGIDDRSKIITLPDERRQIIIQSNEHTQKFQKEKRFIFDGRCWRIIMLDDISDGLINIVLQEDQINPAKDNEELRIVDFKEDKFTLSHAYDGDISIYVNQSLQLDFSVTKNDIPVSLNETTLSSSNPHVGTIDSNGLFTPHFVGTTTINVEYKGLQTNVTIHVRDIKVNNYTVQVIGDNEILLGQTSEYFVNFTLNGSLISDSATFSLWGEDGLSKTTLVTIEKIDGNKIVLKANTKSKLGLITLKVSNSTGLITGEKMIRIKGFL